MAISYTRTTWANGEAGGTSINATRLNNIESGIVAAVDAINDIQNTISPVQVKDGGTGATTASEALSALGGVPKATYDTDMDTIDSAIKSVQDSVSKATTVRSGTVTAASGVGITNTTLQRIGQVCYLTAMIDRGNTTHSGEATAFTVPNGFRPAAIQRGSIGHTDYLYTAGTIPSSYFVFQENGTFKTNSQSPINLVCISYITNDA